MAKNQFSAEKRLQFQTWLKVQSKLGFINLHGIGDICTLGTTELGFPVGPSHVRTNARILNIRLPRSHKDIHINNVKATRKSFTCECGKRYSVGIYSLK